MPSHVEDTQRAAAVLAARANGDLEGARRLLDEFDDPTSMALAFFAVADLAVQVHAADVSRPPTELASQLAVDLARAATQAPER